MSRPSEGQSAAFADFRPAPNQRQADVYELENRALDPDGLVLAGMRALASWTGRTLVDLGCGSGYWLPGYARDAGLVVGIEPDPELLALAARRDSRVRVLPGSAEHLPLADASVDVVHARFAYFWPPGCDAGLAEVRRVLKPGGALVVVDNDHRHGEFAELLRAAANTALGRADATDAWWAERDAQRTEISSRWRFAARADLEAVLRLELPRPVADRWLAEHPDALGLSYGYVLFGIGVPDALPRQGLPSGREIE